MQNSILISKSSWYLFSKVLLKLAQYIHLCLPYFFPASTYRLMTFFFFSHLLWSCLAQETEYPDIWNNLFKFLCHTYFDLKSYQEDFFFPLAYLYSLLFSNYLLYLFLQCKQYARSKAICDIPYIKDTHKMKFYCILFSPPPQRISVRVLNEQSKLNHRQLCTTKDNDSI